MTVAEEEGGHDGKLPLQYLSSAAAAIAEDEDKSADIENGFRDWRQCGNTGARGHYAGDDASVGIYLSRMTSAGELHMTGNNPTDRVTVEGVTAASGDDGYFMQVGEGEILDSEDGSLVPSVAISAATGICEDHRRQDAKLSYTLLRCCKPQNLNCTTLPHKCTMDFAFRNQPTEECKFYKGKKCSRFFFACCNVVDCCHRCHMEHHGCEVRPPRITSIVCDACDMRQSPSAACQNPACSSRGLSFSESHCEKCLVWTSNPISHCDKCGTCRVGRPEELYHCDTCDACFLTQHRHRHRCLKSSLKDQHCPLCLESLHFSPKRCDILSCGHVAHFDCLVGYLSHEGNTGKMQLPTCPTCRKCLLSRSAAQPYWDRIRAAIAQQPLPADWYPPISVGDEVRTSTEELFLVKSINDYPEEERACVGVLVESGIECSFPLSSLSKREFTVDYFCNDCTQRGRTNYHFFGLECVSCSGFNTARI